MECVKTVPKFLELQDIINGSCQVKQISILMVGKASRISEGTCVNETWACPPVHPCRISSDSTYRHNLHGRADLSLSILGLIRHP